MGDGLLWLREKFPNAEIIGADLNKPDVDFEFYQIDQDDPNTFDKIPGTFDLIIDDASHEKVRTMKTFEKMWPRLEKGGLYIIEDFIAHYWEDHPAWATRFHGILDTVTDIMHNKNDFGITEYEVILKDPRCSIAKFKK